MWILDERGVRKMIGSYNHGSGDANLSPNARLNRKGITFSPPPTPEEEVTRDFYVTVLDSGRMGFLAGPYATKAEAEESLPDMKAQAQAADAWACFYSFGTASLPKGTPRKVVFGK